MKNKQNITLLLMISCMLSSVSHAEQNNNKKKPIWWGPKPPARTAPPKTIPPVPKPKFSKRPVSLTVEQWEQRQKKRRIGFAYNRLGINRDHALNTRYQKLGQDRDAILLDSQDPSIVDKITRKGDLLKLANLEKRLLRNVVQAREQLEENLKRQYDTNQISNSEYQKKSKELLAHYREVINDIKYILGRVADYYIALYHDPEKIE